MAARAHHYQVRLRWTGAGATGTTAYGAYGRDHVLSTAGRPDILGSADPLFRGDPEAWNPEQLLLAGLSACHQLWYLHLCAEAGVVVTGYEDHAEGVMRENEDGSGQFESVTLHPVVTIAAGDPALAAQLHTEANQACFLARSVNFSVHHAAELRLA